MWPLFEWKDNVFRRQRIPRKATVQEYANSQRRYAHLTEQHTSAVVARMNERFLAGG